MRSSPVRSIFVAAGVAAWALLVTTNAMAGGQAPVVTATDSGVPGESFHASGDSPVAAPNHPPIDQVPPMPMPNNPDWSVARRASTGPGMAVSYDAITRQEVYTPVSPGSAAAGVVTGGGYSGVDGGSSARETLPATMGLMSLVANPGRANFPYSMNVKLLMRFGASYFVCSGSMRDSNVVLTAGHCVNNGGGGAWADEIWVYPAWDGNGSLFGPPSIVNWYGWAHSTNMASWSFWTVNGDFNYDIGAVSLDRSVGFLTGWFGWAYGGSCSFATSTFYNSASYPAENCDGTLHTGTNMYIWGGSFDSCPNTNRLGLNTPNHGCLGAVWGGMSGSGAYYFDSNNNRFTHAITSTSNRYDYAEYTRQWQDWVDYLNGTFDPNQQGANFNLQPLRVTGPASFIAGQSTGGLQHVAANTSTAANNGSYAFRVYLSTNDDISTSDTLVSTQFYSFNFAPNSAITLNMAAITIPANTPPGTYYLGVIYDNATDGNIGDNDTDGWDALQITVLSADVSVSALTAPANVNPGQTFNVSNTVVNNGTAPTGSFRVGLYLSTDNVCTTGDTLIGSRVVSLGGGGSSAASTAVTIPSAATLGARFICAIADDLGALGEYNETNNTRSTGINILSAVPTVTLKVNGLHPTPPVVSTTGPYNLTISIAPTTLTAALDHYWAIIVNGSLLWITSSGVSTVPAPFMHGPAPVWTDLSLINLNLPHGVTITAAYFMLNGGTVVSSDFITAQTPASASPTD